MPDALSTWKLFVRVALIAVWVQLAIWFLKLPRILDMIESKPRHPLTAEHVQTMIKTIERVANWKWFVIRRNCLKKNLLFYYFLVTSGVTGVALRIGIRKPGQNIDGHCWLTLHGEVYLDSENNVSKYTVIYTRGV